MARFMNRALAGVLRQLRLERGLTQEELGMECGLHRTFISQLERGLKSPSLYTIFRLAAALAIEPDELVRRVALKVRRTSDD